MPGAPLEESVDHRRRHTRPGPGHRRHDHNLRAVERGAAPAAALSRRRSAGRDLGHRPARAARAARRVVPDYFDWRDQADSFDGMAAWLANGYIAYGAGEPQLVNAEIVDGPYFEFLGVQAIRAVFPGHRSSPGAARSRDWRAAVGAAIRSHRRRDRARRFASTRASSPSSASCPRGSADARIRRSFGRRRALRFSRRARAAATAIPGARPDQSRRDPRRRASRHHGRQRAARAGIPATNEKRSAEVSPLANESSRTCVPRCRCSSARSRSCS